MSTGQSESRSNGRPIKGFHPQTCVGSCRVTFEHCVFVDILYIVSTGQSESRSNGGPTKGFHPQLVWDHIT